MAQQSSALSFELRATTSHAKLALQTGRGDAAMARLSAAYQRFDSSFPSLPATVASIRCPAPPAPRTGSGSPVLQAVVDSALTAVKR